MDLIIEVKLNKEFNSKVKTKVMFEKTLTYYETYTSLDLSTPNYQLVDVFTRKDPFIIYYYFKGTDIITDIHYLEIYKKLRSLIPNYVYIRRV